MFFTLYFLTILFLLRLLTRKTHHPHSPKIAKPITVTTTAIAMVAPLDNPWDPQGNAESQGVPLGLFFANEPA